MAKPFYKIISPSSSEEFQSYFKFRWQQLRQPLGMPLGSERDDQEDAAYHCMAIDANHQTIGIGRIHFDSEMTTQIRYMAIDASFQRQGIGTEILHYLLAYADENNAKLCWLKAREEACPFYLKNGFSISGDVDSELPIRHLRMEKLLGNH